MFVTINHDPNRGDGMGTPEDWADRLAKRLEEKRTLQKRDDDAVAMRREIIAERLPVVWEELIKAFGDYCKAYNDRIKPDRTLAIFRELEGFCVKPDARGEIIRARLDRGTKRIQVATTKSKDWYSPNVEMKGNGNVLLESERGRVFSVSEVVEKTFEALLVE
jgi:hypothetical protein